MSQPVIDGEVFADLQETAGVEFVVELIDSFLEDAPQGLAALRRAAATGDATAWTRQAHSLKSNGLTFGATALAAAARELEHTPLAELGAAAPARVDALAALFAAVAADLKERRHA
ncbi:hypothetical protein ASC95_05555 [Pelomonas sp. Root1217]|uniref:Hpt domain-containing protein n=1 Tax=Pelomonas sp. Root1217 TaxID=1736430 RepID=UPI00070C4647|nr:Hpt domain-containing protein [Pelomonas sp. Root1217]KQV60889.1 hypothetical protein ASC95_05555 [Pelomonas sp. Root1217]